MKAAARRRGLFLMSLKRALHRLDPRFLTEEVRRITKKVVRRISRPEGRVVTLEPKGERRGTALFSYILDPFLVPPGSRIPHWHTNYWESFTMGRILAEAGYRVECISWTNHAYLPPEPVDVLVDVRLNLERLAPLVGEDAVKVFHVDTCHHAFHNRAQRERLDRLRRDRGLALPAEKTMPENRGIETADCGTILGNELTASTYAFADKPLFRIPLSNSLTYPWPEKKDFAAARRRFLWVGSTGLVHKGLDLVLEAFAGMPEMELVVCGPIRRERAFEAAFFEELYETSNIHTEGWVDVAGTRFREILDSCLGIVYPSCAEGGGGSVISCMHGGLLPVVTRTASVDVAPDYGVLLPGATVAEIQDGVRALACRPRDELETMARKAWAFVREHHTREVFDREYRRFVSRLRDGSWADGS